MKSNLKGELTEALSTPAFSVGGYTSSLLQMLLSLTFRDYNSILSKIISDSEITPTERKMVEKAMFPVLLCTAAASGDIQGLKLLVDNMGSLPINSVDYDKRTALVTVYTEI